MTLAPWSRDEGTIPRVEGEHNEQRARRLQNSNVGRDVGIEIIALVLTHSHCR